MGSIATAQLVREGKGPTELTDRRKGPEMHRRTYQRPKKEHLTKAKAVLAEAKKKKRSAERGKMS